MSLLLCVYNALQMSENENKIYFYELNELMIDHPQVKSIFFNYIFRKHVNIYNET